MPNIVIDPVTRIEGHLRIEAQVDGGKVTEAWSSGTMFRGMELILQGQGPPRGVALGPADLRRLHDRPRPRVRLRASRTRSGSRSRRTPGSSATSSRAPSTSRTTSSTSTTSTRSTGSTSLDSLNADPGRDRRARPGDLRLAEVVRRLLRRRPGPREEARRVRAARASSPAATGATPRTGSRPRRTSWPSPTTSRRSSGSGTSSASTPSSAARTRIPRPTSSGEWRARSTSTRRTSSTTSGSPSWPSASRRCGASSSRSTCPT